MQTNDEKKIANCPFCRATAQLYIRNNQYTVRCNNHNCIAYDIEPHFISADAAISAWNASERATTDAQEVKHGRWIPVTSYGCYECSVCGAMDTDCDDYYGVHRALDQNYCPDCGAKMDEEDEQ